MPAPKVASVDDFFARLPENQRPHLETLRALSLADAEANGVAETLKWNFPAYAMGPKLTMAWMLQTFKHHCSIRFPVPFFAPWREEAAATGCEAIEGALKIRWDQEIPTDLVARLITERVADFAAGNTAWSVPGQYEGRKK